MKASITIWASLATNMQTDILTGKLAFSCFLILVIFFQELEELLQEEKLCGVPVLVFANKQDLVNAQDPDEVNKFYNQ